MTAISGIFERLGRPLPETSLFASASEKSAFGQNRSDSWVGASAAFATEKRSLWNDCHDDGPPFHDESAGLVVTADLRLDNRDGLSSELGFSGGGKPDLTACRLILSAWQKWGEACPRHLVGDYAFTIWDLRRRTLFCARDHIGARPFYYAITPDRFVFASDINTVLGMPGVSDELDSEYVIASLADRNLYRKDRTLLKAVKRLPPGHSLTVGESTEHIERYWFPESSPDVRFSNDDEYAEAAREVLTWAVNDRLRTDEPVGVHLSGGMDSSGIAVLAARERRRLRMEPPGVYCWQPPPTKDTKRSTEHINIRAVCGQEGLTPQFCPATAESMHSVLSKDPAREPFETTLLVEKAVQARAAADGVRLILSGWGGDETLSFGGQGFYADLILRGRWLRLYREIRQRYPSPVKMIAMEALLLMFRDRHLGMRKIAKRSLLAKMEPASFIAPGLKESVTLHPMTFRQTNARSTMLWFWNNGSLVERMESWTASAAAQGITYAYPLLDRRLMEFAAGLPPEQFVRGEWHRFVMRNALHGVVPESVRWERDTTDPVRMESSLTAIYEAFEQVGKDLKVRPELPSRARFLDMDRLQDTLRPEVLATRPKQGPILHALQFLNFGF